MLFESQHVEAVGSDVVGGTGKGHQPEEGQRPLQPVRGGNCEGHTTESRTNEQLHGDDPPTLGADDIDERTPQWFDNPGQV